MHKMSSELTDLSIAGIRAIHTADGRDIIVNVESSWLNLQTVAAQNDEALIADVIVKKMELGKMDYMLRNVCFTPENRIMDYRRLFQRLSISPQLDTWFLLNL